MWRSGAEMSSRSSVLILLALALLSVSTNAFGDQFRFRSLQRGAEVWTLWCGKGDTHRVPIGTHIPQCHFGDIDVEFAKFRTRGNSIGCALSLSEPTNDENETVTLLVRRRRYFILGDKFAADYSFGFGGMSMRKDISGQSTKTNFSEQLSLGLHYVTGSNSAIVLECRLCHASNAHIRRPNHGINATTVSIGYSWHR